MQDALSSWPSDYHCANIDCLDNILADVRPFRNDDGLAA